MSLFFGHVTQRRRGNRKPDTYWAEPAEQEEEDEKDLQVDNKGNKRAGY